MRVRFSDVFEVNANDARPSSGHPRYAQPSSARWPLAFGGGVSVGGVELAQLKGHDLEVERVDGVVVISGHY